MLQIVYNWSIIFILPVIVGLILAICLWKIRKTYYLSGLLLAGGIIWWSILSQINTHGSEGPGLLALMYSLASIAFVIVDLLKTVIRKFKTRRG